MGAREGFTLGLPFWNLGFPGWSLTAFRTEPGRGNVCLPASNWTRAAEQSCEWTQQQLRPHWLLGRQSVAVGPACEAPSLVLISEEARAPVLLTRGTVW